MHCHRRAKRRRSSNGYAPHPPRFARRPLPALAGRGEQGITMASITEAAHPPARPLNLFAISIMLLLCLSWGINNVLVKLALPEVPPLMQATARSIGGFVIVLIASYVRGIPLFRRDGTLVAGLVMG